MPEERSTDREAAGLTEPAGSPPPSAPGPAEVAPVPPPTPWTGSGLGIFLLVFFLAFFALPIFVLGAYAALRPVLGWRTTPEALAQNVFFVLAVQVLFYAFLVGYLYVQLVVIHGGQFWSSLGWRRPTRRQSVLCLGGGAVLALIAALAPTILPDRDSFPLKQLFDSPGSAYALGVFAVVLAPLMEETIFRGVLFSYFERLAGLRFAVATTAALFAGFHLPEYWGAWNHVALVALAGLVFSLARGWTGSLAPSVLLHLAYNANLMILLFFSTHHFHTLQAALV